MKKIVGILVVAAMATSIFAADVSAKVDINGNLFGYSAEKTLTGGKEATTTKGSALSLSLDSAAWNANMGLSFSDDVSGASFNVSTDNKGWGNPLVGTGYKVWFNAFGLKFNFGDTDLALNKEQIDYSAFKNDFQGNAYSVNYSNNGFALDVVFADGWMDIGKYDVTKDGDPINGVTKVGGTYVKATYAADFGTVGAFMNANFMKDRAFQNIKFGAGYSNNFSGIDMSATVWANVIDSYALKDEKYGDKTVKILETDKSKQIEKVQLELFAKGSADALSWAAYAIPYIDLEAKKVYDCAKSFEKAVGDKDIYATEYGFLDYFGYKVKGNVEYALDACTVCCKLTLEDSAMVWEDTDGDKVKDAYVYKEFGITIEPGVKGKVGACDWEVFGKLNIQGVPGTNSDDKRAKTSSVTFEVPVSFAVAF